jgi:subtilisin family serine protease
VARSLNRPLVICIGLGSSQGNHDGRGALASLLSVSGNFPGVCNVIAAGNEGNARRHNFSKIETETGAKTVELNIGESEKSFSMELWGSISGSFSVDILSPSGEYIPRIASGLVVSREITFLFDNTNLFIDYQIIESQIGEQLILFRFKNPAPGTWRFNIYGSGDLPQSFHIWLPSDDFISNGTYFVESNPYTTITSPGNAVIPITITAYNINNNAIYQNAGRGFSNANVVKPELAAPGVLILSPTTDHDFKNVTGTSAAAAHTAGVAALLLEWGIVKGNFPNINSVEVKKFFIRGADRSEYLNYPNRDWGYGTLNILNAFNVLISET